nr:Bax inhibitor-1/YccA family protein [Herbidospora cretacea]
MESRNPIFSRRGPVGQGQWSGPAPSPQHLQDMYNQPSYAPPAGMGRTLTMDDVVMKGFIVLGTLMASAGVAWIMEVPMGIAVVALIAALILGLVITFKQSTNPALILAYAVLEGVALAGISLIFAARFGNGLVLQAIVGTMMAVLGVLAVYALNIFRPTPKFAKFVIGAAIGAIGLILVNMLVGIWVPGGLGLRSGGALAIVFSAAMILLGMFFLLLDFDEINHAVQAGAPERTSWLLVFGLMLSIVWIYLEVLRLLSYFSGDD